MKTIISPRAEKQLKKLSKVDQIIIVSKIRKLTSAKSILLKGYSDICRVRVGDYRIVYRKSLDSNYIILIAHRREVYELLKRMF